MSGKRCKALRSEFKKNYGRAPRASKMGRTDKSHGRIVTIEKSEWRLLKASYQEDRARG